MCIARNEEALAIDPHFAECYGNMANAWKVVESIYKTAKKAFNYNK